MTAQIVAFGEVMLRLKSPGFERLLQSPVLEATFGGGEANVAVSLAQFGLSVDFVSVLPNNLIGEACLTFLKGRGVNTANIIRGGERMGTYYLEAGTNQRPSRVIYDRAHSAIMDAQPGIFDWDRILNGAAWLHFTGITPALSATAAESCLNAARIARSQGLTVSCDYNFRKNLWKYGRSAPEVMTELVRHVDVGIANEEDCQHALGITVVPSRGEKELAAGQIQLDRYRALCEKVLSAFPNLRCQAITLRESYNANRNGWSACLHNRQDFFVSTHYDITDIVDRVGTGDAFAAGMIYGFTHKMPDQEALEFAAAASCLKHTIPGDMNICSLDEVKQLLVGNGLGRIQR